MDFEIRPRRLITGHNKAGKAVVVADELVTSTGTERRPEKAGDNYRLSVIELWGPVAANSSTSS